MTPESITDDHPILQLQRTIGNQAVLRMLRSQEQDIPRVNTGAPADRSEQEAERNVSQGDHMREVASQGVAGPAAPLPHLNDIQRSFGEYDISGVEAHTGPQATDANQALGAVGYAIGNHVAFAGTPDLRTAAHEAAHVVQQRAGVQLNDGVGRAGDEYERHADAVAEQVVNEQSAEGMLDQFARGPGAEVVPGTTTGAIQLQPVSNKATGNQTVKALNPEGRNAGKKEQPNTQTPVTISAGMKSRKEILDTLKSLKDQLQSIPKSKEAAKSIAKSVLANQQALLSAPVEPTPKRDYVRGPIHFTESPKVWYSNEKTPHFFSFYYESLDDKAWKESWLAFYKFGIGLAGPWGAVASLCLSIILSEPDNDRDRSFDKSGKEKEQQSKAQKVIEEQGQEMPSYYLEYGIEKPMEGYFEKYGTKEAGVIAKWAGRLATAIDVALTAYEIYEANTEGPSLHAAAVETTARIMGRAFNMASGINMQRGQGGEFIPHQEAKSEVRVARNPLDRTPLPQLKDRRLAYDMVGNRVYEMMTNVLAPEHLSSREAFIKFRDAQIANAGNIVDNAGATIVEKSEKFGGKMLLVTEHEGGGVKSFEIGKVREGVTKKSVVTTESSIPKVGEKVQLNEKLVSFIAELKKDPTYGSKVRVTSTVRNPESDVRAVLKNQRFNPDYYKKFTANWEAAILAAVKGRDLNVTADYEKAVSDLLAWSVKHHGPHVTGKAVDFGLAGGDEGFKRFIKTEAEKLGFTFIDESSENHYHVQM